MLCCVSMAIYPFSTPSLGLDHNQENKSASNGMKVEVAYYVDNHAVLNRGNPEAILPVAEKKTQHCHSQRFRNYLQSQLRNVKKLTNK